MAERPTFIDLSLKSHETSRPARSSPRGQLSPRNAYFDGEIPPAMSPLDAFAMQSRLLAKQLDDSQKAGRRVSRLPPLTIANSLAKTRPGYLRSASPDHRDQTNISSPQSASNEASDNKTEVAEPLFRPKSYYPRLSSLGGVGGRDNVDIDTEMPTSEADHRGSVEYMPSEAADYFGVQRATSPESFASGQETNKEHRQAPTANVPSSPDIALPIMGAQSDLSTDSASSQGYSLNALALSRSPNAWHMSSMRSGLADSSDDDFTSPTSTSWLSQRRNFSSSSGKSTSHLPSPPLSVPRPKSPSMCSDVSFGGNQLPRPSYNFSRPLSRSSRPSLDMPSRQPSSDSQRFVLADEMVHTPVSINSEEYFTPTGQTPTAAPSYIYAKFSLPRGRMLQRDLLVFDTSDSHQTDYSRPAQISDTLQVNATVEDMPLSPLPSPSHGTDSFEPIAKSPDVRPIEQTHQTLRRPAPTPVISHRPDLSSASTNSATTIKPRSRQPLTADVELSAEDHVSKGIECHEQGSLSESTYHLRIAAKQNHPTAMLLYALACRHGWGMRPNQREGVEWLRKAADSASLEVADDEDMIKEGKPTDFLERKTRRAQFALSIYELGVSHMNGWGIEQDKTLALRCFEIAGTWGDGDALAEAGFCYAQGVGCKKDLKKAAKFYRMAETKGMSTIGNSWYVAPLVGYERRL